ncbi:hypothetical protein [Nitrosomonas ureae]|nr:hypothetical protein [Nitrosomonas ureae]
MKREIELLKEEIEKHVEEINALEIRAAFYRRHLVLENRLGMIFQINF